MTDQREKRIQDIRRVTSGAHITLEDAEQFPVWMKFLLEEVSRLQVERDKAIEGLRWYVSHPHRSERTALNVLSELGVPHDPLD